MNIALIGYGRMGHEIESILKQRGHSICLIIDIDNQHDLTVANLKKADVAIEFTNPTSVVNNIYRCFEAGIPVVAGSTGWHDKLPDITSDCLARGYTLFHTSNYSIGVNILFAVNEYLARLMNRFPEYTVGIEETHHIHKLDAPSGTAVTIAQQIIKEIDTKTEWVLGEESEPYQLPIKAIREGEVTGIHEISYSSAVDYIKLKHFARSRKGFAMGAVLAAEFIAGKKGVFTMRHLLGL